jgi:tRNA (mo5U34)-methyltransferase
MDTEDIRALVDSRRWFHRITLAPGVVTPGRDDTPGKAELVELPADLTGKTVLDIGAYDGYFSFEAERRGASRVVAYDVNPPDASGFDVARRILGSRVEHRLGSVYDLSPTTVGEFDVVLLLGVIYHLRHPLLALQRIHSVCREVLYVESQVTTNRLITGASPDVEHPIADAAVAEFFAGGELGDDPSNWWAPTTRCLIAWLRSHGFEPTVLAEWPCLHGGRAALRCAKSAVPLPRFVVNS